MDAVSLLVAACTVGLACLLMTAPAIAVPLTRGVSAGFGWIERRPGRAAIGFGVAWMAWLTIAFARGDRAAAPHFHDEFAYLLQARMLAAGHLWLPSPAQPDFFDSFHILVRPVYASKYEPGTAMFYVPAMWLGLPWLTTSVLIAGATFAMIGYAGVRLVGPWLLPVCFAAAATSVDFMTVSLQALSHPALVALAAAAWTLFVAERDRHRARWFALAGVVAGWSVLVRPGDALILVGPPVALMLWRARRDRSAIRCAALVVAGALPFAALMLYSNHGITGSWTRLPWSLYASMYQPGEGLGFGPPTLGTLPPGLPPQKYEFYDQFIRPAIELHRTSFALTSWLGGVRWSIFSSIAANVCLLWALFPLAAFGLARRAMWPLTCTFAATIALYALYPFSGSQYFFAPALLTWIAAAAAIGPILARLRDARGAAASAGIVLTLALTVVVARAPAGAIKRTRLTNDVAPTAGTFERDVVARLQKPAILFVRYAEGQEAYHEERVYNIETARPEDASVMRVHSLGVRNVELLRSVRDIRATSRVYVYDRRNGRLADHGMIDDAIRALERATAGDRPATTASSEARH